MLANGIVANVCASALSLAGSLNVRNVRNVSVVVDSAVQIAYIVRMRLSLTLLACNMLRSGLAHFGGKASAAELSHCVCVCALRRAHFERLSCSYLLAEFARRLVWLAYAATIGGGGGRATSSRRRTRPAVTRASQRSAAAVAMAQVQASAGFLPFAPASLSAAQEGSARGGRKCLRPRLRPVSRSRRAGESSGRPSAFNRYALNR